MKLIQWAFLCCDCKDKECMWAPSGVSQPSRVHVLCPLTICRAMSCQFVIGLYQLWIMSWVVSIKRFSSCTVASVPSHNFTIASFYFLAYQTTAESGTRQRSRGTEPNRENSCWSRFYRTSLCVLLSFHQMCHSMLWQLRRYLSENKEQTPWVTSFFD